MQPLTSSTTASSASSTLIESMLSLLVVPTTPLCSPLPFSPSTSLSATSLFPPLSCATCHINASCADPASGISELEHVISSVCGEFCIFSFVHHIMSLFAPFSFVSVSFPTLHAPVHMFAPFIWCPQPFRSSGAHLMPPPGNFGGFFFFWHVLTISIAFAVKFAPASTLGMSKLGPLDASA